MKLGWAFATPAAQVFLDAVCRRHPRRQLDVLPTDARKTLHDRRASRRVGIRRGAETVPPAYLTSNSPGTLFAVGAPGRRH